MPCLLQKDLVRLVAKKWSLFHANCTHFFQHPHCMSAVDEENSIAGMQFDRSEAGPIGYIEIDGQDSFLQNNRLLDIGNMSILRMVTVRRLHKIRPVRHDAKLKG